MIKRVSFKNKRALTLRGFVHLPKKFDTAVIFCHGFPSSSRGRTAPRIARSLAGAGFLVLRFNFSHTPNSDGTFEEKLMTREVEDIKSAIDFLTRHYDFKNLILIGHSTGAIDASLYAHKDKRISKLILTGAVSDLKNAVRYDFTDEQVKDFWTKGSIVYRRPGHWVNGKRLKKAFYDEFFTLDIPNAIKRYRKPLLIIQGEKDLIPWDREARVLFEMANRPKKFVVIKGADHSFSRPAYWHQVLKQMISFIKQ